MLLNDDVFNAHVTDPTKHPTLATTTNSGNVYSVTVPGLLELVDGFTLKVKFNATSTGSISLSVNGGTAIPIVDYFGNAVTNVRTGLIANLVYSADDSNFQLQGKGGDGTATPDHVLVPDTFTNKNGLQTGTLINRPGEATTGNTPAINAHINNTDKNLYLNIKPGAYITVDPVSGYPIAYSNEPNIVPANIKAGVSILSGDVTGIFTADATATAPQIRQGQTAYVNGAKVTGANPVQATSAQTITPGTTDVVKPAGIYDGAITVKAGYALNSSVNEQNLTSQGINLVALSPNLAVSGMNYIRGCIDSVGNIYLIDFDSNNIVKYDKNYNKIWQHTSHDFWSKTHIVTQSIGIMGTTTPMLYIVCSGYDTDIGQSSQMVIRLTLDGTFISNVSLSNSYSAECTFYGNFFETAGTNYLYLFNSALSSVINVSSAVPYVAFNDNYMAYRQSSAALILYNLFTRELSSLAISGYSLEGSAYINLDRFNNIYVKAHDTNNDEFILKYSPWGTLIWSKPFLGNILGIVGNYMIINGSSNGITDLDYNFLLSFTTYYGANIVPLSDDTFLMSYHDSRVYKIYNEYKVTVIS